MTTLESNNLDLFDKLDFDAYNKADWDLFRELHTDDVVVDMFGQHTEGIDAHVQMCQAVVAQSPDAKVTGHPIKIAQGEWTAVMGELAGGVRGVTIARWRDGAIAEEYIFTSQ